jgi:hypothetical protein
VPREQANFRESARSLASVLKSMNSLVPGVSVVGGLVLIVVGYVVVRAGFMMGFTALVVFIVGVAVYARTSNYGEAALALVAGLLTVFTVTWRVSTFSVFLAAWGGFTILVFLISSVRLASRREDVYTQAALSMAPADDYFGVGASLEAIGKEADCLLDPIERAEVIRIFAYRKLPLRSMRGALEAVDKLSTISRVEPTRVASFIADVFRVFEPPDEETADALLDHIYSLIRDSVAAPQEYFEAFDQSRRLILAAKLNSDQFFNTLNEGLEAGVPVSDIYAYMSSRLS